MESKVLLPFCHTLLRTPARIFFVVVRFAFKSKILLTDLVAAHQTAQEGCFGGAIQEEVNRGNSDRLIDTRCGCTGNVLKIRLLKKKKHQEKPHQH